MSIFFQTPKSNPLVLAIETTSRLASVAVFDGKKLSSRSLGEAGLSQLQTSNLVPAISELLQERGATFRDIGLLATSRGPGSFTGLRIGLAATQGFLLATKAELYGVSTFEIWAHLAHQQGMQGEFVVALDTRRDSYYTQVFGVTGQPQGDPTVLCPLALEELRLPIVGDAHSQPLASVLISMISTKGQREGSCDDLTPLYVHTPTYRKKTDT